MTIKKQKELIEKMKRDIERANEQLDLEIIKLRMMNKEG